MNSAFKTATGDFIIPISSDDIFYEKTTVSQIIKKFITYNCDILVTSRLDVDINQKPIILRPHYIERKKIQKWDTGKKQYYAFITSMHYDMAAGCAIYYSRRIIEKLNYYDENFILWEDGPMILKYTWNDPLYLAYDIISIRCGRNGVSSSTPELPFAHNLLLLDAKKFCERNYYFHYDELPKNIQRYVELANLRMNASTLENKISLCLKNPDITLKKIFYMLERKINEKIDKLYIRKMGIK